MTPGPHDRQHARPQAKPRPPKSPPTDWGKVAEWYDDLVGDEGSEFQREIIFPGVLRLLKLQPGEKVLDVACGQGALCRLLAEKGAEVTGIDAAEPLVRLARERGPASIRYLVGDARQLSTLPEASFDAATCVLAIQNIDQLAPAFDGIGRLLKPMGRFVLVMMHPCFRGPKHTSWGWDAAQGVQFRRTDRYLLPRKEPIVTHPGKKTGEYTWSFHRPLQNYVRALRGAGMLVDGLEEWPSHKHSDSGPRAAAENQARREIPMFMAVRAVKAVS
jgi:ubiquinone/menaquinone biosynthesis C-methylase UbiE